MTHDQGGNTEDVKQHDDCLQVDEDAEGANGEVIKMDRTLEMAWLLFLTENLLKTPSVITE